MAKEKRQASVGNKNAAKNGEGVQVTIYRYLNADETAAIKRVLARQDIEPTPKEIRAFYRRHADNGLWLAIRDDMSPMIV